MISYKFKLYKSKKTKHLDATLREACGVWNHALALQRRYYRLFGKFIPKFTLAKTYDQGVATPLSWFTVNARSD